MELSDRDFENLRGYINEIIGFSLGDDKKYLVEQRLEPLVQSYGRGGYADFYQLLRERPDMDLKNKIIAAITTNETSFFRDGHPFETFRTGILPTLFQRVRERKSLPFTRRGAKVKIWSAGSSTGQEPYTLAMLIAEALAPGRENGIINEDFSILASDISSDVLARAMAGRYEKMEMARGVPTYLRDRYFIEEGSQWAVKEEIQRLIEFKRINLVEPFMFAGSFEVIFCRNVLIYFDMPTRTKILEQFHQLLNKDGFLMLGASENIYGITDLFESEHYGQTIIYRKRIK